MFGSVPEIAPHDFHREIESSADGQPPQILDVRFDFEWKGGHIKHSTNLPLPHISHEKIEALGWDRTKPTYAICLSAHRSISAVRYLQRMGFENVKQLQGGMQAWRKHGLPENNASHA